MTEFSHSKTESFRIFEPHYLLISFEQILISLGEETKTFRLIDERRRGRREKTEGIWQQLIELYEKEEKGEHVEKSLMSFLLSAELSPSQGKRSFH
jgi:hypothetical protein